VGSPGAKVLSSRMAFKGKVCRLRVDKVREPGGVVSIREVVAHDGSVVVLPVFDDGSILMVRQYRYAAGQFLWELVAGHLERGEKASAAAPRELGEEAGYTARRWRKLLDFFPSPGVSTERMYVYLATGLTRGKAHPEEDERITARRFSLSAIESMIRRGTLHDAKTIAAVLFYQRFVRAARA
jgi:ADP-ribose pyrophosphatase